MGRAEKHDNDVQICKRLLEGWEQSLLHVVVSMAGLVIH